MDIFRKIAEQRITEAMDRGEFEDLAGKGSPFRFDEEPGVGEDLKMAYKIMKNAGCVPPEVDLRREINEMRDLLRAMDEGDEKARLARELNFKLMKYNMASKRPFNLSDFPEYEDKIFNKLTRGKGR